MPSKLSERVEEKYRQYLVSNIRKSEIEGYDPNQTDSTATDFLPISSNWNKWGDYYPFIYVAEDSGPELPNSGQTNINGVQGNGSGPNQYSIHNVTISVQVAEGGAYRNGIDYDDLAHDIYQEIQAVTNGNTTALSETLWMGTPTPPTPTRNPGEDDNDSLNWYQTQGTVPIGIQKIPE